jgi:hypothetical protein
MITNKKISSSGATWLEYTLFYSHNGLDWEPYLIYSYQCILKEFCGVVKVAIGHGKILEGMIITFFYILIWMMIATLATNQNS